MCAAHGRQPQATVALPECPLWVKSVHCTMRQGCPLYPRKRTLDCGRAGEAPPACCTYSSLSIVSASFVTSPSLFTFRRLGAPADHAERPVFARAHVAYSLHKTLSVKSCTGRLAWRLAFGEAFGPSEKRGVNILRRIFVGRPFHVARQQELPVPSRRDLAHVVERLFGNPCTRRCRLTCPASAPNQTYHSGISIRLFPKRFSINSTITPSEACVSR